ncbi:Uncharacterised protein [Mycobacterium tuberculosis]|nr:Uncharacterised protein [Mycobacterium tuberculosis]
MRDSLSFIVLCVFTISDKIIENIAHIPDLINIQRIIDSHTINNKIIKVKIRTKAVLFHGPYTIIVFDHVYLRCRS